ncbi:MAG: hypothetical protein NW206_20185 [Hyphomonadaceae bacterium]|nr:hypothetical protein [Hyphomonadaceae bacterium]
MRGLFRGTQYAAMLALAGLLALGACQRQEGSEETTSAAPTDAQREAEIAAEQLAALGGPANAQQRAAYAGEFQAVGALGDVAAGEGAWELRLLEDYAQFSRPGLGEDGGITSEREYYEHGMRVSAGPLTITLMAQPCMLPNGVEEPYTASVLFEGVAYQGCARQGVAEGERPTWASVLPELMPAIDVCLQRARSRPARVTFASAIDEGQVSVRIRESNSSRYECIADAGGGAATVYEPLSDIDRRSGEGDPEFQRGGSRPGSSCVTEAVGREGETLGWLIADRC